MRVKFSLETLFLIFFVLTVNTSFANGTIVWSFEKKEDVEKWGGQYQATIERVEEHATDGEYSARIIFPSGGYPGVFICPEEEDWSKYIYLCLDFHNPGKEGFGGPAVQLFDDAGANIIFYTQVFGEETLSYKKYLPALFKANPGFNLRKVKKLTIFKGPGNIEKVLYLDNIRLEPVSETLFKLPQLCDFEANEDFTKWGYNSALFEKSDDYSSEGDYSAKVTFLSKNSQWLGISCSLENGVSSNDWSKYEKFAFDIFNTGEENFNFGMTFANFAHGDPRYKAKSFSYGVGSQEEKEVEFSIAEIAKEIDLKNVSSFSISIGRPEKDVIIYFDNFRLISKGKDN